jgi:hypothetical protein
MLESGQGKIQAFKGFIIYRDLFQLYQIAKRINSAQKSSNPRIYSCKLSC